MPPRRSIRRASAASFETACDVARALPDVEVATRYDGAGVFRAAGRFMASAAVHASAEPGTLVVRVDPDERDRLVEDAPETYYTTSHYAPHPVVLVRLSTIDVEAVRDLLSAARRLTLAGAATTRRRSRRSGLCTDRA